MFAKFRFLAFLLVFQHMIVHSQKIQWEKSYGGKHSEYLFDAISTADYGFILAGSSLSGKSGNKTNDANGNLYVCDLYKGKDGPKMRPSNVNIGGEFIPSQPGSTNRRNNVSPNNVIPIIPPTIWGEEGQPIKLKYN